MRVAALIALTAVAASSSSDPRAGRIAGKPAHCVAFGQAERLVIADPATLTLRDGRRLWVTQPEARCTPMNVNDILILEPQGAQLCRGDRFRTVQPGTSIPGAYCRLGVFVPYDLPRNDPMTLPTEDDLTGVEGRVSPKPELEKIGDRKLKPSTLMMGHGYDPMLSEGSLKPPIFLTSTFVFPNAAAGKRHFEGVTGKRPGGAEGLVYSRFNGPNQEILEDRLGIWEGAEDALAFSSGMSAIATLFLAMVKPGDTIVHSGPLYAATETLIGRVLGKFGVTWLDFPAGATREEIDAVMTKAAEGNVALIYLESPANPTNALVDVEAVAASRDAIFGDAKPPIAIDNTFLGPLWHKPLEHGADLVIYSLTKYAGGHSDLVAGGLLGSKEAINVVRAMRNTIGTICDPNTAWMLLRSLETLELRMSRAGENAQKVCTYLRDHPKVEHVGYLGFLAEAEGRQADIYRRHCNGGGSTFSLYLKGGEAEAFRFLDALRIAKLAVSLGGTETLASHPAGMTHLSVPDARKQALGITDNLVRISIGVEDADDLIADMEQALAAI